MIRFAAAALAAAVFATPAAAISLVLDQEGATVHAGGLSIAYQTFQQSADNIAGVDIYVYTGGTTPTDVTMQMFATAADAWSGVDALLDETTTVSTGTGVYAEFRFGALSVTPDTTYWLAFEAVDRAVGSFSGATYDRGARLARDAATSGSFNVQSGDLRFRTYADADFAAVPLPPAAALLVAAVGGLVLRRRG